MVAHWPMITICQSKYINNKQLVIGELGFVQLTKDVGFIDQDNRFKVKVFYRCIDKFICQVNSRFESMANSNNHFTFLTPKSHNFF